MNNGLNNILRIGIFYDGHYFYKVSTYYNYMHERKARISISGLHEFIRNEAAKTTSMDVRSCQIVDAHYFRGRMPAAKAEGENKLYNERVFDDILMHENVTSHYLPLKYAEKTGRPQEKGVDVWLALEAYELAIYKRFDILVLVVCDGDYVPLVRKLNTLGTHVMLISWDLEYVDDNNNKSVTKTSQQLLEEVAYPISMHDIIDSRVRKNEALVNNLFVSKVGKSQSNSNKNAPEEKIYSSAILKLKDGYGFIKNEETNNVFFYHDSLENIDFKDLKEKDPVRYKYTKNSSGNFVATSVWINR